MPQRVPRGVPGAPDPGEAMVPSAARFQAPVGPTPPPAPSAAQQPRKAGRARKPLPPLGLAFAGLAMALAAASLALEALDAVYGILLLPVAASLLALAAALPVKAKARVPPEPAKLRLVALALVNLALLLALATVEGIAAFAATGLLFSFSQLASLFVRAYPLVLAGFLLAGGALRVAAGLWGRVLEVPRPRRRACWLLAAASVLPAVLVNLAAAPGGQELFPLTVERAPFVSALGVMAALGALWSAALPSFPQMGDWLGRAGLRQARIARHLTKGFAGSAVVASALGLALWVAVQPELGVPLLGLGLLLAMLAAYPAGVARFVPAVALEDPERALRRQKQALHGMLAGSIAGFALAGLGMAAAAWAFSPDYEAEFLQLLRAVAAVTVGVSALLQAALALASPRFPVPGSLPDLRRSVAWDLSLATLLLTFFGLLLGSGLAQGPGVGPGMGVLLLLGAALASGGHVLLRVVLVPPLARAEKPSRAKAPGAKLEPTTKEQITRSMHLTYAAGLGFTALMVALVAATSLGVVDVEESTGLPAEAFLAIPALLGLPVVGFFAWRYLQVRRVEVELRQQQRSVYKKRLTPEEVSRLTILAVSISAAVVCSVFGVLTQFGMLRSFGPFDLAPKFSTDFFVFAILVGLGPFGFMRAREQARTRAIDAKFPEFLRDLAESKRAGMTLTQAVITASKGSYGALTHDIRRMAAQIEWGVSFSEALQRFAKRVKTPLIERSVSLIVQAGEAGGNVVDILTAAAEDAREIQLLLRERKTSMSIYVMIIYISFFVFLAVVAILDAQFLPEVAKAVGGAQGVTVGPIKFGTVDVEAFEQVFFHAAIIQALGGGFVAGVMEEGRPVAGLKHVFVMVIFGYIGFRFVIGG